MQSSGGRTFQEEEIVRRTRGRDESECSSHREKAWSLAEKEQGDAVRRKGGGQSL